MICLKKLFFSFCGILTALFCSGWAVWVKEASTPPERQGKQELERYLPQVAIALKIGDRNVKSIDVIRDDEHYADEEYEIRFEEQTITLTGGGSRGALYATYAFLENYLGIHWWPIRDEYVPPRREFVFQPGSTPP